MAKKSKTQVYDITKLGPQRYDELQQQNMEMQGNIPDLADLFPDTGYKRMSHRATTHDPLQNMQKDVYSPLYKEGDYWGKSVHDENIASGYDWEHLTDARGENQWAIEKVLNGTIKMGTTAATTFLDSTVGALWGLIQGTVNLFDKDPNTGFWQGMWDNDFNRSMMEIQDAMEKVAPNYYTERELNNPWYENIFTANFLGDKLLKNAGFTVGAVAAMTLPGVGVVGTGARAGVEGLGKLIQTSKYIKNAETGARIIRGSQKVGGVTEKLINSFISANGEAAIESINAVKANEEALTGNIDRWVAEAEQNAEAKFRETGDERAYREDLATIAQAQETALQEAVNTARALGNSVYFGNVALLMLTNNLEFGKYIKGGWKPQKGMESFDMMASGKKVASQEAFGRALAEGTGALAVPEEVGRQSFGRIAAGTLARVGEEGFEEGAQNIISDSGQMQQQAILNKWAKNKYTDSSLFASQINPEVTDDLVDRMKAIGHAWDVNFGAGLDAPGWEEVFLGGLTGGIGTISVHTNPTTGKWNVWEGGFIEEVRRPKEERQQAEKVVEAFNKYVQSSEFRDRARHAIAAATLADTMDSAVGNNDIMAFKNAELMSIANDALYFRSHEGLPAYKAFYERMAETVTDEDVATVKSQLRNLETGQSWVDSKTPDELKQALRDKAKSTLDKANSILDLAEIHQAKYADALRKIDEKHGTKYLGAMLDELTAKAALIEDLNRRKTELEKEQVETSPMTRALRGDTYAQDIKQIDSKISELTEQYNTWIKDFNTLHGEIDERVKLAEKYRIGQDAQAAKERLKTATTIQDVADFYFSTNPEFRQRVFDQATRESEGEVKGLLTSFRPFIATVNSLTNLISKQAKDYAQDLYDEWGNYEDDVDQNTKDATLAMAEAQRISYESAFTREVQRVVDSFIQDSDAAYDKKTLERALRERAADLLTDEELNANPATRAMVSFLAQELNKLARSVKTLDDTYRETAEYREAKKQDDKQPEDSKDSDNKPAATPKKEERKPTLSLKVTGKNTLDDGANAPAPRNAEAELAGENEEELPEDEETPEEEPENENPELEQKPRTFVEISTEGDTDAEADRKEDVLNTESEEEDPDNISKDQPSFVEGEKEEAGVEDKTSFRGNAYHQYKASDLVRGIASPNVPASSYYRLLKSKGIDIDFLQNNLLYQMRALFPNKALPVEYMVMRGGARGKTDGLLENHIFLVTPYTKEIEQIVKRGDSQVSGNIITSNGREYVVVGTLGYSERQKGLSDQYGTLKQILRKEALSREGEEFIVHDGSEDNISNYIYDQTPGYVIRKEAKEPETTPANMSLKTLLDTANPRGLKFGDLHWLILEGKESDIPAAGNRKWINKKADDKFREPVLERYPGKLYLFLPAADGTLIPQYCLPINYRDMSEANGPIWQKVEKALRDIAKTKTPQERKLSFGKLRDLFVFKPKHSEPGTNIFYNEETNTVTYSVADLTRRGQEESFTFDDNLSEDEIYDRLVRMMADANPRFRINARDLARDPGYYINNGMIQVNLRNLGTFDSRSYVYPLNADGTPAIDFQAIVRPSEGPRPLPERIVYFQDQMYRIVTEEDGTFKVYDKDRAPITDGALLRQMQDIMLITTGQIPSTRLTAVGIPNGKRFNYYISALSNKDEDTFVYVQNRAGSYRRISGADLQTFRSRLRFFQQEQDRQQAVQDELSAPIEPAPEEGGMEEGLLFENPPFEAGAPLDKETIIHAALTSFKGFPEGVTEVGLVDQDKFPFVRFEHRGKKYMFTFWVDTRGKVRPRLNEFVPERNVYLAFGYSNLKNGYDIDRDWAEDQATKAAEQYLPKDFLTILQQFEDDPEVLIDKRVDTFERKLREKFNIYYLNSSMLGTKWEADDPSINRIKQELLGIPASQKTENSVDTTAKNPNFVKSVMENFADNMDTLATIGRNAGYDWDNTPLSEIEEVLRAGKYGEIYTKVHDAASLQEYLDTIEECGI